MTDLLRDLLALPEDSSSHTGRLRTTCGAVILHFVWGRFRWHRMRKSLQGSLGSVVPQVEAEGCVL